MNTDQTREAIWQAALTYQHTVASEYRLKDAIARHERAIKAETLRDVADAWSQGAWAGTPRHRDIARDRFAAANYVGDWLRARADRIESEATDE